MERGHLSSERIFLPQSSQPRDPLTDTQSFASAVTLKLVKMKQCSHGMVFILKQKDKNEHISFCPVSYWFLCGSG